MKLRKPSIHYQDWDLIDGDMRILFLMAKGEDTYLQVLIDDFSNVKNQKYWTYTGPEFALGPEDDAERIVREHIKKWRRGDIGNREYYEA